MISTAYQPQIVEVAGRDRRQDERYEIPIDVMVDIINTDGVAMEAVPGLIINISRTGACLILDQKVSKGSFLSLKFVHEKFNCSALVIDVKTCGAAVQRVHVQFAGSEWK